MLIPSKCFTLYFKNEIKQLKRFSKRIYLLLFVLDFNFLEKEEFLTHLFHENVKEVRKQLDKKNLFNKYKKHKLIVCKKNINSVLKSNNK